MDQNTSELNKQIINGFLRYIYQVQKEVDNSPPDKLLVNTIRLKKLKDSLKIIKNYPKQITKGEDLADFKGIGKGTISRINDIIKNKIKLKKLTENQIEKLYEKGLNNYELEKVYGIGRRMAIKLSKQKIVTIDQLKNSEIYNELPHQVKMGIKYYGLYERKIPRREIKLIQDYLLSIGKLIDKDLIITLCGSYRRGNDNSNDIDVLITHKKQKLKIDMLNDSFLDLFILKLSEEKFLLDYLSYGPVKYSGFCRLNEISKVRRIDIRYVPYDSYFSALLYFTGSAEFNVRMRNIAKSKGMKLNEYGIYSLTESGKLIKMKISSEDQIFKYLGINYIHPTERKE